MYASGVSQMLPPELAAALGGGGQDAGGGGGDPGAYGGQGGSPLDVLQQCIQSLPGVIQALPDAKDTQEAVKALLLLTGIQTRMMSASGAPGQGNQ